MAVMEYTEEIFEEPTDRVLYEQAFRYLKDIEGKRVYRNLKITGTLKPVLLARVDDCKEYARNLIATGVEKESAWNRARRLCLLFSETD